MFRDCHGQLFCLAVIAVYVIREDVFGTDFFLIDHSDNDFQLFRFYLRRRNEKE